MYVEQFFVDGLGQASYLVGDADAGVAAVIDPRRDVDVYLEAARAAGLAIRHVLETHTHNDYVSGAKDLASLAGADLWASGAGGGAGLAYPFQALREGDVVRTGGVTLRAWETPGHTPEHLAYAAFVGEAGQPQAVFTGGSLMVGSAGRTDLTGAERTPELARAQYVSLRRLFGLPDGVQVFPTHGGGSFCGGGGAAARWSTIGTERATNRLAPFIARRDPDGFARTLLERLPVIPAYWGRMRPLNQQGPRPLADLGAVSGWAGLLPARPLPPAEVRAALERGAAYLVDARDPAAFGGAHVPGSFGVGLGATFGTWVGSVVPDDRPLVLLLPGGEESVTPALAAAWEETVRQLVRAGYDEIRGYLAGGMRGWAVEGLPFESLPQVAASEAAARLGRSEVRFLDVRQPDEWHQGHARGAVHVPGASLPETAGGLEADRPWLVACSTGYRSTVAASVLRRAGFRDIANLLGGMSAWERAGLPVERDARGGGGECR
jgi:hydroxyacylglutathione hydrolase